MKKRILAIGTHPDDIEIGCGGTIRCLADKDAEIKFVIVTSGEEGALLGKDQLREKRESEAKASARILGAMEIFFLREPDGLTTFPKETKVRLIQIIREFRPEVAFIHASDDNFADHRIVHELSKSAIEVASGPWYGDTGPIPHSVTNVFGYEVWNPIRKPQMTIDITETMALKLEALECHESQIKSVNYLGGIRGLNEYRGAMTITGKYAESFEVIRTGSCL